MYLKIDTLDKRQMTECDDWKKIWSFDSFWSFMCMCMRLSFQLLQMNETFLIHFINLRLERIIKKIIMVSIYV